MESKRDGSPTSSAQLNASTTPTPEIVRSLVTRARSNAWLEREERFRAEAEEEANADPEALAPREEWVRRFRRT